MNGSYLGPSYKQDVIEKELASLGAKFEVLSYEEIIEQTSKNYQKVTRLDGFKEEWNLVQEH